MRATKQKGGKPARRRFGLGLLLPFLLIVGGCSSVPDSLNPAEWYKSTTDLFSGKDGKAEQSAESGKPRNRLVAERGQPAPGADKPFPNLASVPQGLAADRRKQRYTEAIPRQGEAGPAARGEAPSPPAPPPEPSPTAAAPSAPGPTSAASQPAPMLAAQAQPAPMPAPPSQPEPSLAAPSQPAPMPAPPTQPAPLLAAPSQPAPPALPTVPVTSAPASPATGAKAAAREKASAPPAAQAPLRFETASQTPPAEPRSSVPASSPSLSASGPEPLPVGPEEIETIVVSSTGIETAAALAGPAATGSVTTYPSQSTVRRERPATNGKAVNVATIVFANGSAKLTARDRRILADVYRLYRERGGRVRVVGHASHRTRNMDPVERSMVNLQISVKRADVVARQLMRLGVKPDEISVDAVSDSEPLYYEFMPSGEAGNRRTEIYFES